MQSTTNKLIEAELSFAQNAKILSKEILSKLTDIKQLGYSNSFFEKPVLRNYIQCIVIARLALFIEKSFNYLSGLKQCAYFKTICIPYLRAIFTVEEDSVNEIYLAQVLHASRGLLDTVESAETYIEFLGNVQAYEEKSLFMLFEFNKTVHFWKSIVISSPLLFASLEKIIKLYDWDLSADQLIEHLKTMKIGVVLEVIYWGMVVFDGIVISQKALNRYKNSSPKAKSYILKLIIHESMHFLIRILYDSKGT
jgi:hypothetical protein